MKIQTLSERILDAVRANPQRKAFTHLDFPVRSGNARVERSLTIGELHERATRLAAQLRHRVQPGEPVLLLFRSGLEFVEAFVACVHAGVVAVPVPLPRRGLAAERVQSILADCGARAALATSAARELAAAELGVAGEFAWILVDGPGDGDARFAFAPNAPEAIALVQYSSGSTGEPKGVRITHANLVHQAEVLCGEVGAVEGDTWVTWLPAYHDMGLVSGIVTPLVSGLHSVLMSPDAFALRPARWLRALSDFRATCSASPNFGYELCARKVRDEDLDGVDLSCVRFAVSGAEPVRAVTAERFLERFGSVGFGRDVIYPAYGLAESTLLVTGHRGGIKSNHFDTASLAAGIVVPTDEDHASSTRLVSCGQPRGGSRVVIADPETRKCLPELHVGEIRVAGDSVGAGYWGSAGAESHPFASTLADAGDERFLHTGDLGFYFQGELYVCGRLKDLLVIHGKNHHAADIEHTVEALSPLLVPSGAAAFAIEAGGEERLVVVQELVRQHGLGDKALADLAMRIRQRISERHQIAPHDVVLVGGGLPRTSSGKIRRFACRELYLGAGLKPLASAGETVARATTPDTDPSSRLADCELWLCRQFAEHVRGSDGSPNSQTSLAALKRDAAALTAVTAGIKRNFGLSVSYVAFSDHETIGELAAYLCAGIESERAREPQLGGRMSAAQLAASPADAQPLANDEPIAIVGIACRFPDANSPGQFWDNLCRGIDSVTEVPSARWDAEAMYDPNPLAIGKMNTKRGGFLTDVESFDARFFGIQNREATRIDPAHRMLLELSWELFEDAGLRPEAVSGRQVGVFVGISGSDYAQLQFGDDSLSDPYAGVGCALTNSASRISHFHDLRGPALAIDTACSSSLSAVHLGATAVRSGECEMALVGGVNIILAPNVTMSLSKAGMMAPDGRCKTFDAKADGYVRSEGVGLLLLKPLSKAKADGDQIYALIRSSATNQDGHGSAISAPNGEAQQRVIKAACERAGIQPGDLDYVEAHGTGTALGDPIEVNALGELLKLGGAGRKCAIGSVKTNIGHCESAAGAASLIKAAMVLKHGIVPPSLNFETPNPLIAFADYTLRVQRELGPLPEVGRPRLAGVNSFGIGGTNVHVVLEEHIEDASTHAGKASNGRLRLLPLSGKTDRALKDNARAMAEHLRRGDIDVADACHTAALRRTHLDHRMCVLGADGIELAAAIEAQLDANHHRDVAIGHHNSASGKSPEVAFVFAGQGSQWWAMGRRLFEREPVYRRELERCDSELGKHTGWSVLEVLMSDEHDSRLEDTVYLQPALFAVQCSITALLASWGIRPSAVVGHSFGEITAACVAGAIDFPDACRLIAARARLMGATRGRGHMVSVEMPRDELAELIDGHSLEAAIAASNSPGATVVSGTRDALARLSELLDVRGVASVDLGLGYAFHSPLVDSASRLLASEVEGITARRPTIGLMSTVLADWIDDSNLPDADYWRRNIRDEVRFRTAVEAMAARGHRLFVEIGGHPVLTGAVSRTLTIRGTQGRVFPSLSRDVDDEASLKRCVAALHANGITIDWTTLCADGRFVRGLPSYRWDRQRYWLDAPHHEARARISAHPLVSNRLPVAHPVWQSRLDINANPYIRPVRVRGNGRLANGLHLELALEAAAAASGLRKRRELVNVRFHDSLARIEDDSMPLLQSRASPAASGSYDICVDAQADASLGRAERWQPVLECTALTASAAIARPQAPNVDGIRARQAVKFAGQEIYRKLGEIGIEYVHAAFVADEVRIGDGTALLDIRLAESARANAARLHLSPLLFEAMEQACRLAAGSGSAHAVLASIGRLRVFGAAADAAYAYAAMHQGTTDEAGPVRGEVWLLDADGVAIALAEDIAFAPSATDATDATGIPGDPTQWRYEVEWSLRPVGEASGPGPGHWLILADAGGVADRVAERLSARGDQIVMVRPGDAYARNGTACTVNATEQGDIERLVRELYSDPERDCPGVLHFWNLDVPALVDEVPQDYAHGVTSLVDVVRALSLVDFPRAPRLSLITRGAQSVEADELSLLQPMAWGCAKTIVHEHAELRCARYDLGQRDDDHELDALCAELLADRLDDQVAFRGDRRYVARLTMQPPAAEAASGAASTATAWSISAPGEDARQLLTSRRRRRSPGDGEIELALEAASVQACTDGEVNLAAVAGRVLRVGRGVDHIRPGQRAVALASGSLESHLTLPATAVTAISDTLTGTQVVAALRDYLAALFGLREVAQLARGQRVLVRMDEAARGMPVVQLARWFGATLSVSAPRHLHPQLDDFKLARVFDEGDAAGPGRAEEGNFDLIVNAAREFRVSPCLLKLRTFGHCIDLANSGEGEHELPAGLPGNCRYARVDFDGLRTLAPERAHALLQETVALFEAGTLVPETVADIGLEQLPEEIGGSDRQLVLRLETADALPPSAYRDNATYLITGGLGGLGLAIARRMVRNGARHLVLVGRRAPSISALDVIEELNASGADCRTMAVDIADYAAVRAMLCTIEAGMPPLRGIIHAAGILDNGLLVQMGHEQVRAVMPAKVHGAWNLHRATAGQALDFFVMFSSLASIIGSPGQSNYAAANAFLDGLAEHRRNLGLPGLAIAWGPWSEAGMAADAHNLQRLAQHGMGMVTPDKGLDLLEDLIIEARSGAVGALPMNWNAWSKTRGYAAQTPYFASLMSERSADSNNGRITSDTLAGKSADEQMELLTGALRRAVCNALMLDAAQVDLDAPLTSIGLDSIVSLELKDRIEAAIDVVVRTNSLVTGKSIRDLAEQFMEDLARATGTVEVAMEPAATPAANEAQALLDRLDELSNEEIEAMLGELAAPGSVEAALQRAAQDDEDERSPSCG